MSSPRLSIVLPSLNDGDYISNAVESILDQTFSDFELIVVDDGSDDGTMSHLRSFNDDRLTLIHREDESGVTSARNRGIDLSEGEFVAVHDADDRSAPDRFEKQIAFLEKHPEVALVGSGAYLTDEHGDTRSRRRVLVDPSLEDLIEHNEFVHGSVLIRRDALEAVGGYDEWFPVAEDYELWLRLASEYDVRNIDQPLYYFRQHDGSLYERTLIDSKIYHLLAVKKATDGLDDDIRDVVDREGIRACYDCLDDAERKWFHEELSREFIRYGNLQQGRTHVLKSIRLGSIGPQSWGMLALTATTPWIARRAARVYRRIINRRIRMRNR